MSIEVIEIEDQPDGTSRVTLDIDKETVAILLESAVVTALREYINNHEEQYDMD
jgi:tRNA threonylcarbamoyladenosine modification (KEOPS) complex  Pcc1 subunit